MSETLHNKSYIAEKGDIPDGFQEYPIAKDLSLAVLEINKRFPGFTNIQIFDKNA
jgi:hypothetical protein